MIRPPFLQPGHAAVPAPDEQKNRADARLRELMFRRQLRHRQAAEKTLDADLAMIGFERTGGVEEIEHQRIVQPAAESSKSPADRAGGLVEQPTNLSIACPAAKGELDQDLVGSGEEGDAIPDPIARLTIGGSKGGSALQNNAF